MRIVRSRRIGATFVSVFGTAGAKVITVIVLISFLSCVLSLQAAASRLLYSYARDHMVFASRALSRFHATRHVPPVTMIVAAVVPALVYGVAGAVNLAWPRGEGIPSYDKYTVLLGLAVVIGVGVLYMVGARPYTRSGATAGDAIRRQREAAGLAPAGD